MTTGRWAIDRTQSATAWTSISNDLFITNANTRVGSNNYLFTNDDIGNSLRIHPSAGFGTGSLQGVYHITGIAGTLAILNASPGGIGTAGGTWTLGGAVNNPNFITIIRRLFSTQLFGMSQSQFSNFVIGILKISIKIKILCQSHYS